MSKKNPICPDWTNENFFLNDRERIFCLTYLALKPRYASTSMYKRKKSGENSRIYCRFSDKSSKFVTVVFEDSKTVEQFLLTNPKDGDRVVLTRPYLLQIGTRRAFFDVETDSFCEEMKAYFILVKHGRIFKKEDFCGKYFD